MDKEDFFDMLVAFAEAVGSDSNPDTFDWALEQMENDFSDEMIKQFKEQVG